MWTKYFCLQNIDIRKSQRHTKDFRCNSTLLQYKIHSGHSFRLNAVVADTVYQKSLWRLGKHKCQNGNDPKKIFFDSTKSFMTNILFFFLEQSDLLTKKIICKSGIAMEQKML